MLQRNAQNGNKKKNIYTSIYALNFENLLRYKCYANMKDYTCIFYLMKS